MQDKPDTIAAISPSDEILTWQLFAVKLTPV